MDLVDICLRIAAFGGMLFLLAVLQLLDDEG